MLTIVACAQYQMKQKAKLKAKLLQQQQSHTQPAGTSTSFLSPLSTPYCTTNIHDCGPSCPLIIFLTSTPPPQITGIIKHHRQIIKAQGPYEHVKAMHGGEMNGIASLSNGQVNHSKGGGGGVHSNGHSHSTNSHIEQVISRTSPRQQARKNIALRGGEASKGDGLYGSNTEDRDREHLLVHPNRLHGHTD